MGEDVSDNTHEDDAAKSLEQYLVRLPEDELLRMADEIREMTQHPGWAALASLCEMKAAAAERSMQRGILSVFARGHALRDQAPFLRAAGVAVGLRQPVRVADKVQRMAKAARAALENDDGS